MNIDEFWQIIDKGIGSDEPETIIAKELKKLPPEEIVSYQKHFDTLFDNAYKWNLWGAAYLIGGGCSDDGFVDFRYGLISMGRKLYEGALKNPDSLVVIGEGAEIDNESFGYLAHEIYEDLTGEEISYEKPEAKDDSTGEEWDFDDEEENKNRLPALTEMFW
jgi:hypothetical protein